MADKSANALQLHASRTQMLLMLEEKVELCQWMLDKQPDADDVKVSKHRPRAT